MSYTGVRLRQSNNQAEGMSYLTRDKSHTFIKFMNKLKLNQAIAELAENFISKKPTNPIDWVNNEITGLSTQTAQSVANFFTAVAADIEDNSYTTSDLTREATENSAEGFRFEVVDGAVVDMCNVGSVTIKNEKGVEVEYSDKNNNAIGFTIEYSQKIGEHVDGRELLEFFTAYCEDPDEVVEIDVDTENLIEVQPSNLELVYDSINEGEKRPYFIPEELAKFCEENSMVFVPTTVSEGYEPMRIFIEVRKVVTPETKVGFLIGGEKATKEQVQQNIAKYRAMLDALEA